MRHMQWIRRKKYVPKLVGWSAQILPHPAKKAIPGNHPAGCWPWQLPKRWVVCCKQEWQACLGGKGEKLHILICISLYDMERESESRKLNADLCRRGRKKEECGCGKFIGNNANMQNVMCKNTSFFSSSSLNFHLLSFFLSPLLQLEL